MNREIMYSTFMSCLECISINVKALLPLRISPMPTVLTLRSLLIRR